MSILKELSHDLKQLKAEIKKKSSLVLASGSALFSSFMIYFI